MSTEWLAVIGAVIGVMFVWLWFVILAAERAWRDDQEETVSAVPEGWDAVRRIEKERGRG